MTTRIQSAADMALAFGGPPVSWTPELWDNSNSGAEGQAYGANNEALIVRVGNFCFIQGVLDVSGLGTLTGTDPARIGGLLYTPTHIATIAIGRPSGLSLPAAGALSAQILAATDRILLYLNDSTAGATNLTVTELSVSGEVPFTGWYITDDPF